MSASVLKGFRYYSLRYLDQWVDKDRHYFYGLQDSDSVVQLKALKSGATFYKIARNLKTPELVESGSVYRYKQVLDVLNEVDREEIIHDPHTAINKVNKKISVAYGKKNLLSATTKFLWMKFRSPVYIYDSLSLAALEVPKNDIEAFRSKWVQSFEDQKDEIRDVCMNLKEVYQYSSAKELGKSAVSELSSSDWFLERVHDLYLIDLGKVKIGAN